MFVCVRIHVCVCMCVFNFNLSTCLLSIRQFGDPVVQTMYLSYRVPRIRQLYLAGQGHQAWQVKKSPGLCLERPYSLLLSICTLFFFSLLLFLPLVLHHLVVMFIIKESG